MNKTSQGLSAIMTRLLELAMDLSRYQEHLPENARAHHSSPDTFTDLPITHAGLASVAKRLLKEADDRGRYFANDMFSDPVWRILLDLYVHTATRRPVSVTSACVAAGVPAATAHRWITALVDNGMIEKTPDAFDRRRFNLQLSAKAFDEMSRYLAGITGIEAWVRPAGGTVASLGGQAQTSAS